MSVNFRLKATMIIGQRKAFYRQRTPGSSCARKETVDIAILVTSRYGDRKIMQFIRITSRLTSRKGKWNQLSQFWKTSTKVIPTEKTYTGHNLTMNQVKDQQSCISFLVACLTIPRSNWGHQSRRDNSIPYTGIW